MTDMLYIPTKPNARLIWQRCMPSECSRAERVFWSDIILYVREKPSKAMFFELLIRNLISDEEAEWLAEMPADVLVDKMIAEQSGFDDDLWSEIVKEWAKIKIELKIRTQTVLLQNDDIIKDFLMAVLGKSENPRHLINKMAEESGLLGQFAKSDVIMMICSIVAESLMYKSEKREFDMDMKEGVFEIADDMELTEQEENKTAESAPVETSEEEPKGPVEGSIALKDTPQDLNSLFDDFVEAFSLLDPLGNSWEDTEKYLGEIVDIANSKIAERDAIIKRRNLLTGYRSKLGYVSDVFSAVLADMGIYLPKVDDAEELENDKLEMFTELFTGLHSALQKYSDLSASRKVGLAEEKKRIAQLFTAMTDIENLSGKIQKLMGTASPAPIVEEVHHSEISVDITVSAEEKAALLSDDQPEETKVEQHDKIVPEIINEDKTETVAAAPLADKETQTQEEKEDDMQLDLFAGKD